MLLFEVEGGAQTHSARAAATLVDSLLFEAGNESIALLDRLTVESNVGALAAHVLDLLRESLRQRDELFAQEGAGFGSELR